MKPFLLSSGLFYKIGPLRRIEKLCFPLWNKIFVFEIIRIRSFHEVNEICIFPTYMINLNLSTKGLVHFSDLNDKSKSINQGLSAFFRPK